MERITALGFVSVLSLAVPAWSQNTPAAPSLPDSPSARVFNKSHDPEFVIKPPDVGTIPNLGRQPLLPPSFSVPLVPVPPKSPRLFIVPPAAREEPTPAPLFGNPYITSLSLQNAPLSYVLARIIEWDRIGLVIRDTSDRKIENTKISIRLDKGPVEEKLNLLTAITGLLWRKHNGIYYVAFDEKDLPAAAMVPAPQSNPQ